MPPLKIPQETGQIRAVTVRHDNFIAAIAMARIPALAGGYKHIETVVPKKINSNEVGNENRYLTEIKRHIKKAKQNY